MQALLSDDIHEILAPSAGVHEVLVLTYLQLLRLQVSSAPEGRANKEHNKQTITQTMLDGIVLPNR